MANDPRIPRVLPLGGVLLHHCRGCAVADRLLDRVADSGRRVSRQPPAVAAQCSKIATARVHPAEAAWIFTGKQATSKPSAGSDSRLWSFSIWR